MLTLPSRVRVQVATQPIDLRKSFDGLSSAVGSVLGHDPCRGDLLLLLQPSGESGAFWARTDWCIVAKRLVQGRFGLARRGGCDGACVQVAVAELMLILEGIELAGYGDRYRLPSTLQPVLG